MLTEKAENKFGRPLTDKDYPLDTIIFKVESISEDKPKPAKKKVMKRD